MGKHDRYYAILDLAPGASTGAVKQAYRELVQVWHPDRFPHNTRLLRKANQKLAEINEAYGVLVSWQTGPQAETHVPSPRSHSAKEPPRPSDGRTASADDARGGRPRWLGIVILLVILLIEAIARNFRS